MRALSWSLATFTLAATIGWFQRTALLALLIAPMTEFYEAFGIVPRTFALGTRTELGVVVLAAVVVTLPVIHAEVWVAFFRAPRRRHGLRLTVPFALASCGAWWLAFVCARYTTAIALSTLQHF